MVLLGERPWGPLSLRGISKRDLKGSNNRVIGSDYAGCMCVVLGIKLKTLRHTLLQGLSSFQATSAGAKFWVEYNSSR